MQRYQRECFWNAIVWPLLWPLMLLQTILAVLCLAVWVAMWWVSPSYPSWNTTLWLMLALLIGSSLNMGTFLMLVRSRARRADTGLMQQLAALERHSQALCITAERLLPGHHCSHCSAPYASDEPHSVPERLARVNDMLMTLERLSQGLYDRTAAQTSTQQAHEKALLEELQQQQRQLQQLKVERERAREESLLKTSYLTLLQSETDSLLRRLNAMVEQKMPQEHQQSLAEVGERLMDIRSLLANLVQQTGHNRHKNRGINDHEHNSAVVINNRDIAQRSLRVLVVDDGPVNLMLTRQMLETQGLTVESVSSGELALERQHSVIYDLVFMDIYMPTLDGLQTTQCWRQFERNQGCQPSVLVALTANADNAGRDACLAVGMDDLLIKPYQPETLLAVIARWFPDTVVADSSV